MNPSAVAPTVFEEAVAAAVLAPSMYNSQPWRFRRRDGRIEVLADRERDLPASDPTGWAQRLACGAAAFNLRLALAVRDQPFDVRWLPGRAEPDVLAWLVPADPRPATPAELSLYHAIPRRHSHRQPFRDEPVPGPARSRLIEAARAEAAWLELLSGTAPVAVVGEIARAAHRVLSRDPRYSSELTAWTRATGEARDGVPASAGGPSPEPRDLLPQRHISDQPRPPSVDPTGPDQPSEPLVGVLGTAGDRPADQLIAGYALQRVLLTLTDLGLAASLLSQPIEVPSAREQLRLALGRYGTPQMVLRIGFGDPGPSTLRREPGTVIEPAVPDNG